MQVSKYVLAWLAVTIIVTGAAWAVVATASDQVNDTPVAPIIDAAAPGPTSSTVPGPSSTLPTPNTGLGNPDSSTTTPGDSSSTSTPAVTPSTTTPGGSTTTAPAAASSGTKTVSTAGGTVTVSYSGGNVYLQGATPAIGYSMEVEDDGPDKVRVDFEAEESDFSVRIEWIDGQLDIEIEE